MQLKKFIEKVGDEEAARLFGQTVRCIQSWRLGERFPQKRAAEKIVANSPVTYAGIYSAERRGG